MTDAAKQESGIIHIKVKSQDAEELNFKIKRNTPLKKLMEKYIEKMGIKDMTTVNFLYEGEKIHANSTPERLGMNDGDEIEVTKIQVGGCN